MRLRIDDESLSQEPTETCDWPAFVKANRDCPDVLEAVSRLAVGQSIPVGGDDPPMFTVTRLE